MGGAGYIGSVLVRRLLKQGYRVRVLDALLYNNAAALDSLIGGRGFSFQHGDFCRESDLNLAMEGITDVVHLAALVGDPVCRKYPDQARRINETGTLEMIDRLNQYEIGRFVFMSTCSNYGLRNSDSGATEESELNPQSLYAETKVRVERHILNDPSEFHFCATVLRAATAYGLSPRMRFDLTVNEFTRDLALGKELLVYDADTWRPYCHVEDISSAILCVLEADDSRIRGEVFNVGTSPENYTKRMIVDLIRTVLSNARVRYQTGSVDPRNYKVSFEKIATRLNFRGISTVAQFVPEVIEAVSRGQFDQVDAAPSFYTNLAPISFPHNIL